MVIRRFDVVLVELDPAAGSEIKKRRPCVVVSPDEMNRHLRTVILAPMTTASRTYASRVACRFKGKAGQVALDQIRSVDKSRLVRKLGALSESESTLVLQTFSEMFAP